MSTLPPNVLLIDDDVAVLGMVGDALTHFGMKVHAFSEGDRALHLLEDPASPLFDLVISDINMEGMDGFDVINRVKATRPSLPVVLMTGQASLDYAIRAMRMGASNLFQKPLTIRELVNSVFHLVDLHREIRLAETGLRGMTEERRCFRIHAGELDIPSLVAHLTDRLVPMDFATASNVDVIGMAFHEALVNALEHGCLELDSGTKGDIFAETDAYATQFQKRLADPHYAGRLIEVESVLTAESFTVTIQDGGPGFDTSTVSTLSDMDLNKQCGRGLPLILLVMDKVVHNEKGNAITLVLNKKDAAS
ncbi:ATP-binding response regulator [Mesoterricola silvestris]|uniref:Two-component system response regulator n=1 Tax=Mesoterricola silvestris TaxID=2927979 RepID=A0AA48KAT8_9BACT|nr:response regulator [Mesoterricola silvestris]BDU74420.1 two-component system response regulator [Mesoterricola silvestris]